MDLTFIVPSRPIPVGGILAMYEYAHALLDRGHSVRLVHVDAWGVAPTRPEDLAHLVSFDPRIDHRVIDRFEGDLRGGDVVFCFDQRIPTGAGLPVMFVQSVGGLAWVQERAIHGAPCPKVCGSSWLEYVARALGNPDHMTVNAPPAIDLDRFRPTRALVDRPPRALMIYGQHILKGARVGIGALHRARLRLPGLEASLYGTAPPPDDLPGWITYLHDPPQPDRAGIYNDHRCFVLSSWAEGFGISGIEAQACGTPLVVTANGGSADYAHHEVDALVSDPHEIEVMADHIVRVLTDDDLATRLSSAGRETAASFSWSDSGEVIDGLLHRYVANPPAFQQVVPVPADLEEADLGVPRLRKRFYAGRTR